MSETTNRAPGFGGAAPEEGGDPAALERRLFRSTCVVAALAVLVSLPLAPWRVTTGLLLGGALALLNHHWLRTSMAAAFGATPQGARPRLGVARFVLRYLVVAAAIASAVLLDLISLPATLVGMCAFVPAALAEGFVQLYFAIFRREEA